MLATYHNVVLTRLLVYNTVEVSNQEQSPLVIHTIGISITNMLVAYVSFEVIVEHTMMTTITTSLQRPYISTSHIINHAQTIRKEILNQDGTFSGQKIKLSSIKKKIN